MVIDYPTPRDVSCPFVPTKVGPLRRVRIWNGSTPWLITRHADQRALLADPRVSIDEKRPGFPHMTRGRGETAKVTPPLITNTDAPEHTRLRRMVNGPFMVKRIEALRPRIQRIVDDLVDAMLAGPQPADLVTALGLPMPTLVITELLGVPYEDHEFLQANSNRTISHAATGEQTMAASGALAGYLDRLLRAKMDHPGADLLSEMAGRIRGGEMTHTEAVFMGTAILIAGHETTANMISLGTLALLRNPGQLALLRDTDDPKVIAGAVEELLRYLTIVHTGVRRIADADIELGDWVIRAGEGLVFDLSAADWDPAAFPEPDRLDLTRPARHHHAFGAGVHQCLGQSLVRVELQVAYPTLARRVPTLRLAVPFERADFNFDGIAYGLRALPVSW
jgi:cytochrome P450